MRPTAEERDAHMRKLPDGLKKWAEEKFDTKGFIYYTREGSLAYCMCGACGQSYVGQTKKSVDPFLAAAQHTIHPAHNKQGKCEKCGYETLYKACGKAKRTYSNCKDYAIGQRLGKEEFVFRIFRVWQEMQKDGATQYEHNEYARVFLRPGKKAQKDYYVYSYYSGLVQWIDHNLGGYSNITLPDNLNIYPGTYKEIEKTPMFQYVPRPILPQSTVIRYYEAAAHYSSDFEMLVKNKMNDIVDALIWNTKTGYRTRGKTYYDRLGIYKSRVKDLAAEYGNLGLLRAYQIERKIGRYFTSEEIEVLKRQSLHRPMEEIKTLTDIYKHVSPVKVENYIDKQIEQSGCGAYREYMDYLRMRKEEGYDLTNEIFLFPKELHRRHNEMVLETEKTKIDKRKAEVLEKYPIIAEKYKKLDEKYSAAAAGLYIRPAKDAAEIVTEGRVLHHCVGGDGYLSSHNTGRSYILFLRKANERDIPWITVEMRGNKVLQWYGQYDRKNDKDSGIDESLIDAWLATYTGELEKRQKSSKNCTKNEKNRQKTA